MEMKHLLPLLALLTGEAVAETVIGAYIFHRHGDRTTKSYKPTSLTALGADQVYTSGNWYRNRYIASNSSNPILNIASDIALLSQLSITAPTDNVLQASAEGFTQSLYPPAGSAAYQTLANGEQVQAPLGGYQYIPVNIVSTAASTSGAEDSGWLQGSSGCAKAVISSNEYFQSDEYIYLLNKTGTFYQDLLPVYNSTFDSSSATYKNAYTIFDYVHVSEIHNQSIPSSDLLTNETLHQLQTLADAHEWGLAYNESDTVRAIAGSVLAGQILEALNTTMSASLAKVSSERLNVQFGAYASFMSFFGLANLTAASEDFKGIVDYASSMAFELVTNATVNGTDAPTTVDPDDVSVRFIFSNGSASDTNPAQEFPLFGQADTLISWNDFVTNMQKFSIADTSSWCQACGNTTGICASSVSSSGSGSGSTSSKSSSSGSGISPGAAAAAGVCSMLGLVILLAVAAELAGYRMMKKGSAAAATSAAAAGSAEKKA
ncbi:Lysosomal acid phosphatase [Cytospora mali]|uniref:Lysosomal acid phosphatase n=1 Tax=Cytospora mali TaxID=578113 RepID=A0A194VXQ1_CYTMA|nr:Lysosomal acid phosphatase [Valsa mali]